MIELSVLVDKLNGMTCDEIRAYMVAEQVTGCMQEENYCVLANWLRRESGRRVAVGVHIRPPVKPITESFMGIALFNEDQSYAAGLPISDEVTNFIKRFDNNWYPTLVIPIEEY